MTISWNFFAGNTDGFGFGNEDTPIDDDFPDIDPVTPKPKRR